MKKLLANRWKTPDGTILWSKHTHDFILYTDKNGKQYGVDGGNSYCRMIGNFEEKTRKTERKRLKTTSKIKS